MEFKEIYNKQKTFQELIMNTYNWHDREKFLKDLLMALNSETFEVLNEINWKTHKPANKIVDENKLLFEMIDVIKYALSLPACWGFTAEQIEKALEEKTRIVEQKFQQEIINKNFSQEDKVIGIDIDGVLLSYPEDFVEFCAIQLKSNKNINEFKATKHNVNEELAKFLEVDEQTIKNLKHKYRSDGYKKNIKAINGASHFVHNLMEKGYKILLLSARPTEKYPNLMSDTMISLEKAKIIFNGIYFNENKEEEILNKFPHILFFIEDNIDNAKKITKAGKKVFLINRTYNQENLQDEKIIRINYLHEIFEQIDKVI